jgi:hypothetical protein
VIISVAVCPHPPLLIPTIAAGAAFETDDLRAACDEAVARMLAAAPEQVIVIGADGEGQPRGLQPFAPGVKDIPDADLPLALTIGCWLLDRAQAGQERQVIGVRPDGTPTTDWPATDAPTGLLVMADGTARRSLKGPGYLDERAQPFDAAITEALSKADADTLANLDAALAQELLVGGLGAFKALAALAALAGTENTWQAEVLYDAAPYGVQYTVASWLRA